MSRALSAGRLAALVVLPLLAAGCIRPPEYRIAVEGALPSTPAQYRLARPEGEPALPAEIETRLLAQLQTAGFTEAAADKPAPLLLFATLATRPVKTGSFTRDNPADQTEAPHWVTAPEKKRRRITTVSLRFIDVATGESVRVARAEALHGKRDNPAIIPALIDSAASGTAPSTNKSE